MLTTHNLDRLAADPSREIVHRAYLAEPYRRDFVEGQASQYALRVPVREAFTSHYYGALDGLMLETNREILEEIAENVTVFDDVEALDCSADMPFLVISKTDYKANDDYRYLVDTVASLENYPILDDERYFERIELEHVYACEDWALHDYASSVGAYADEIDPVALADSLRAMAWNGDIDIVPVGDGIEYRWLWHDPAKMAKLVALMSTHPNTWQVSA